MKVYFAADHAGFEIKNQLLAYVRDELKMDVEDCGAFVNDPADDYPGIIAAALSLRLAYTVMPAVCLQSLLHKFAKQIGSFVLVVVGL